MYYVLICKNHSQLREDSKVKGSLVSVNMKGNQDNLSSNILGPQGLRLLSTSLDLGIGRLTCKVKVHGKKKTKMELHEVKLFVPVCNHQKKTLLIL